MVHSRASALEPGEQARLCSGRPYSTDTSNQANGHTATTVHSNNNYTAGGNITFHNVLNVGSEEKKCSASELRSWLSSLTPVNHFAIHEEIYEKLAPGTGAWILKESKFRSWICGWKNTFWGVGIPGSGKTYLTSFLVRYLQETVPHEGHKSIVAFAYCRFNDNLSVAQILATFLGQITRAFPTALDRVRWQLYDPCQDQGRPPVRTELLRTLEEIIAEIPHLVIVVDALDELQENVRADLVKILLSFQRRVFFTSRDMDLPNLPGPTLYISAPSGDFRRFITGDIDRQPKLRRLLDKRQEVLAELVEDVVSKSRGMFLLAALYIEALGGITNVKSLRSTLQEMPNSLNDMYQWTLARIEAQSEEEQSLACRAILWLTHSYRPLTANVLLDALAVVPESTEFDPDAVSDEGTLVSVCCGLVRVEQRTMEVRLIHYTAYKFFATTIKPQFQTPHTFLATTCLVELSICLDNSQHACGHKCSTRTLVRGISKTHPFIEYSCQALGHHIVRASEEHGHQLPSELSSRLIDLPSVPLWYSNPFPFQSQLQHDTFTLDCGNILHFAAYHGLLPIIMSLHGHSDMFVAESSLGFTPIICAVLGLQAHVARYLLESCKMDIGARFGPEDVTLLHWISYPGSEELAEVFLNVPGVPTNARDAHGQTPLHIASKLGHASVVKLLLAAPGIEVNPQNDVGCTPLILAAENGHSSTVELFLDVPGIDVNFQSHDLHRQQTVLHHATRQGYAPLVEKLLKTPEIKVNATERLNQTALHHACKRARESITALLVDCTSVDVKARDHRGRTPLHLACIWKDTVSVSLLLRSPEVDVNAQEDKLKLTPLHCAVDAGDSMIVQCLLGHKDIDIGLVNKKGHTALQHAILGQKQGIVEMFLGRRDLHPDERAKGEKFMHLRPNHPWKNGVRTIRFLQSFG